MGRRAAWNGEDYPVARPREARGGIKAATRRGDFARQWWSRRWIAFLESFPIGARLGRGRTYARKGQVLEIQVREGRVETRVQGSRPSPYRVRLLLEPLSEELRDRISRRIAEDAALASELLSGRIPEEVERVFVREGATLFPNLRKTSGFLCTCPDASVPCKHIAAVFYLLGEAFDADPFLILTLRGLPRERLLAAMGEVAGAAARARNLPEDAEEDEAALTGGAGEGRRDARRRSPVPLDASFFVGEPPEETGPVVAPSLFAPDLRRLGPFPFWRGEEPLLESLLPIYEAAAGLGEAMRRGEPGRDGPAQAAPGEELLPGPEVAPDDVPRSLPPARVPRKRGRPRKNP